MSRATRTWLIVVATCCAVAAVLILPTTIERIPCPLGVCEEGPFDDVRIQRAASRRYTGTLVAWLREAEDLALVRQVPAQAGAGEPVFWFAPNVSESLRAQVRTAIAEERSGRGRWRGNGRVAIVAVIDTASLAPGRRPNFHPGSSRNTRVLYPSAATDGRCITVIHLRSNEIHNGVKANPTRSLMDACAFFDAFGQPGRAIAAALDSGRYSAARAYWPAAPDSIRAIAMRQSLLGYNSQANEAASCAAGNDRQCEVLVAARVVDEQPMGFRPLFRASRRPVTAEMMGDNRYFALFDAIAHNLGPERFAKLWRSDAPLVDAYREVAGTSITAMVRPVATAMFSSDGRRTGFGLAATTDPSRTLGSALIAIIAIVGLGVAATRVSRRPVAS